MSEKKKRVLEWDNDPHDIPKDSKYWTGVNQMLFTYWQSIDHKPGDVQDPARRLLYSKWLEEHKAK